MNRKPIPSSFQQAVFEGAHRAHRRAEEDRKLQTAREKNNAAFKKVTAEELAVLDATSAQILSRLEEESTERLAVLKEEYERKVREEEERRARFCEEETSQLISEKKDRHAQAQIAQESEAKIAQQISHLQQERESEDNLAQQTLCRLYQEEVNRIHAEMGSNKTDTHDTFSVSKRKASVNAQQIAESPQLTIDTSASISSSKRQKSASRPFSLPLENPGVDMQSEMPSIRRRTVSFHPLKRRLADIPTPNSKSASPVKTIFSITKICKDWEEFEKPLTGRRGRTKSLRLNPETQVFELYLGEECQEEYIISPKSFDKITYNYYSGILEVYNMGPIYVSFEVPSEVRDFTECLVNYSLDDNPRILDMLVLLFLV